MTTSAAHPIDIAIFVIFLAVNLIVGLRYGKRVANIRDYALGGKNFSTATLAATIVATWSSGSLLFIDIENTYSYGLYYLLASLGLPIGLLLTSWLAPRMEEFMQNVSIAEAIEGIYGKAVQIITAFSGIVAKSGYTAMQFKVMSTMITSLFNLDSTTITCCIAAGIVIIYSSFGGIRAVTFTDVIQFFTFGTIIPILALVVWNSIQAPSQVVTTLMENPVFDIKKVVGWNPRFMSTLNLFVYFVIPGVYAPEMFQRIAMAKNTKQVRHSFTYAAGLFLLISLFTAWIGILLLTNHPGLAKQEVVPYMINNHTYVGLKGLLGIGVMALAMSTADSLLNSSSVLFANDIIKPLTEHKNTPVIIARSFVWGMGLIALLLALYTRDLLSLLMLSSSFYLPIVTVPMLLAVLGFRSSTRAVLIGMAAGFVTVVLWSIYLDNANSILPGILANLIGLIGSHYLLGEKGGWQKAAPNSPLALERAARRQAWQRHIRAVRSFQLYPYLQQNLPAQESLYFFFGLYTIAATYTAFYTIGNTDVKVYQDIYEGIYRTVLFATTVFLTFPIWSPTMRSHNFMAFFWPLGIGAVLFFAGTLLAIMSHFHYMQVMIMMINLLIAVLLLRWPLALFLALTGVALAVVFFKQYTGSTLPLDQLGSLQFRILYGLLLLTSLLIALFKGKQAYRQLEVNNKNLAITNQETADELLLAFQDKARFSQAFRKSGAPALIRLTILSKEIREALQKFSLPPSVDQKINELNEQLAPIAIQLDRLDHRATNYLRLVVNNISINTLLAELQDRLCAKGIDKGIRIKKITQQATLQCDVERITTLLINGITFLRNVVGEEHPILLSLEDTKLGYSRPSVKKNYIKTIDSLRFTITTEQESPKLEQYYLAHMNGAITLIPQSTQELPLATNKRITEAHYGYTNTVVREGSCTLLYVIPVDLREVRPKDMDDPHMDLDTELARADDTYPGAQGQEQAFLEEVEKKTQANLDLVRKAVETIKNYHGSQVRKSGEPFYLHPLSVAQIVLDYNQEEATVLGALLHDTVEDTPMLLENIEMIFNKEVARIVDGVTHLDSNKETFYKLQLSAHENTRKLLELADKRALYVKLADRMHNMRTIQAKPSEDQRRIAEETLLFFVPLAAQLGFLGAAEELKERCFSVLNGKIEASGGRR